MHALAQDKCDGWEGDEFAAYAGHEISLEFSVKSLELANLQYIRERG